MGLGDFLRAGEGFAGSSRGLRGVCMTDGICAFPRVRGLQSGLVLEDSMSKPLIPAHGAHQALSGRRKRRDWTLNDRTLAPMNSTDAKYWELGLLS
jgi:hypothetical protein